MGAHTLPVPLQMQSQIQLHFPQSTGIVNNTYSAWDIFVLWMCVFHYIMCNHAWGILLTKLYLTQA